MRTLTCILVVTIGVATVSAMDVGLDPAQIEAALKIARGDEPGRAAFHRAYLLPTNDPAVERLEVITEFRRVVQMAEARLAGGDHLFAQGTRAAQEALRPYRGRVSVMARLRFHPQNAYVMAPPIDVSMLGPSGAVPRLDLRSESLMGLASGIALASGIHDERLPVVGASAEAAFDAAAVGQTSRLVVVQMHGVELARARADFSRMR